MEPLEVINQRLLDIYGRGVRGLPAYRVVWSTNETEVRTRDYVDIFGSLRNGTEEVPKYPMFPDVWVLEIPQPNLNNPNLHAAVSFEPLWVFYDPNQEPLPYDWEVIEKIIYFHKNRTAPQSQSMLDHAEQESIERQKLEVHDFLTHDGSFPNRMFDTPIVTIS